MTRAILLVLSLFVGCAQPDPKPVAAAHTRGRDLDQCRAIAHSGEDVQRCLIVQHDWDVTPAQLAGFTFQRQLDGIGREIRRDCARDVGRIADSTRRADYIKAGVNPNPQNAFERFQDSLFRDEMIQRLC